MSFRKALTITSLSVLFALLFTACGSEDKVETIPVLTVKTNPVTAASGSQFISVTATRLLDIVHYVSFWCDRQLGFIEYNHREVEALPQLYCLILKILKRPQGR
jgi:hypothetical protein